MYVCMYRWESESSFFDGSIVATRALVSSFTRGYFQQSRMKPLLSVVHKKASRWWQPIRNKSVKGTKKNFFHPAISGRACGNTELCVTPDMAGDTNHVQKKKKKRRGYIHGEIRNRKRARKICKTSKEGWTKIQWSTRKSKASSLILVLRKKKPREIVFVVSKVCHQLCTRPPPSVALRTDSEIRPHPGACFTSGNVHTYTSVVNC